MRRAGLLLAAGSTAHRRSIERNTASCWLVGAQPLLLRLSRGTYYGQRAWSLPWHAQRNICCSLARLTVTSIRAQSTKKTYHQVLSTVLTRPSLPPLAAGAGITARIYRNTSTKRNTARRYAVCRLTCTMRRITPQPPQPPLGNLLTAPPVHAARPIVFQRHTFLRSVG